MRALALSVMVFAFLVVGGHHGWAIVIATAIARAWWLYPRSAIGSAPLAAVERAAAAAAGGGQ
jgi:hypothetical protein